MQSRIYAQILLLTLLRTEGKETGEAETVTGHLSILCFFWASLTAIQFLKIMTRYRTGSQVQYTEKTQYRKFETNIPKYFDIHVSVSDLYISTIDLPILLQENMWTNSGDI
jgi:hypothetical protein